MENSLSLSNTVVPDVTTAVSRFTVSDSWEAVVVPLVFVIIFIVGIAGNGLILFTVAQNKSMQSVPNMYFATLAVGDLMMLSLCVPFAASTYTFTNWPYGDAICKMNEFIQVLSVGVTIFTLTALALERYFSLVTPFGATCQQKGKRHFFIGALAVWVSALVVAVPDCVAAHTNMETGVYSCSVYPDEWGGDYPALHRTAHLFVLLVVPLLIIAILFGLIARHLLLQNDSRDREITVTSDICPITDSEIVERQKESKLRLEQERCAGLVLLLVVVFVACWLPHHMYLLWYSFNGRTHTYYMHNLKLFAFCLKFANSSINPFFICILDRCFLGYFRKYVCCGFAKKVSQPQDFPIDDLHDATTDSKPTA